MEIMWITPSTTSPNDGSMKYYNVIRKRFIINIIIRKGFSHCLMYYNVISKIFTLNTNYYIPAHVMKKLHQSGIKGQYVFTIFLFRRTANTPLPRGAQCPAFFQ